MLGSSCVPTLFFARSILNGGRGHSNSRSLGGSFEIGGSGGIRGRRRLRGDTELQPRCYQASRRAQRRRFEGLASRGDRPRGRMLRGGCERGGRGRRVERVMALWQCRSWFSFAFAMQVQRQKPPCATPSGFNGVASSHPLAGVAGREAAASAEGEGGGRGWRWRCGNAMRDSNACLQCKFEGKRRHVQRIG